MNEEPTPRTNAERRRIKRTNTLEPECVGVEFCRTLERELNAMRAVAGELADAFKPFPPCTCRARGICRCCKAWKAFTNTLENTK